MSTHTHTRKHTHVRAAEDVGHDFHHRVDHLGFARTGVALEQHVSAAALVQKRRKGHQQDQDVFAPVRDQPRDGADRNAELGQQRRRVREVVERIARKARAVVGQIRSDVTGTQLSALQHVVLEVPARALQNDVVVLSRCLQR